jgi:hypothetical protein
VGADIYQTLAKRGSEWARLVENLTQLEGAVASIPFEEFFEPGLGPDSVQKLTSITSAHLVAWTRHVAYGTIARLGSLTRPCLNLLAEDDVVIAGLVERCMLEHAARAAHTLERLRDSHKISSWESLRELIPKTLFGTCLTNPEGTVFEDMAESNPQRPVKPTKLIESLESFAGTSETGGTSFFPGLYAFLCDLTHASQRANSGFCQVASETGNGWFLQYQRSERNKDEASLGALRGAMRCLQAGYGASAMLLFWRFEDDRSGLLARGPDREEVAWVWHNILDPNLVFWTQ